MSRAQAHAILDARRNGRFISQRNLIAALRVTGDIPASGRPAGFSRVADFGRNS